MPVQLKSSGRKVQQDSDSRDCGMVWNAECHRLWNASERPMKGQLKVPRRLQKDGEGPVDCQ